MLIVYFSNFINHHQSLVGDELYKLTHGNFFFVELIPMFGWLRQSGYEDLSSKPYVIQAWKDENALEKANSLCLTADVALFAGHEALEYQVKRAKIGKLSFEVSERWLKRGMLNVLSPRLIKNMWYYHTIFKSKPVYKLCSSAFGARDQYKLLSYKDRCFKWGYFTKVDRNFDIESKTRLNSSSIEIKMMWCARFLKLKHPELPIQLAYRLKMKGYKFTIDMFGSGTEFEKSRALSEMLNVSDIVKFRGNLPNKEILEEMSSHNIFLFTSDSNEGWGAVANESMSNGCVLVASDAIGSVPFLLSDGYNGLVFKSCDINSIEEKVEFLLNNPDERARLSLNGYNTMKDVWSPENAARNFMILVDDLMNARESSISEGPCSKALPL